MSLAFDQQMDILRARVPGDLSADAQRFVHALGQGLFSFRREHWHDVGAAFEGAVQRFPAELLIRPYDRDGNFSGFAGITELNNRGLSYVLNKALLIAALDYTGAGAAAINVASQAAKEPGFWCWVKKVVPGIFPSLDPSMIIFELTEDDVSEDFPIDAIANVKEDGYRFALDDFTGSDFDMQRLRNQAPILDFVKIDGTVIEAAQDDPQILRDVVGKIRSVLPNAGLVAERVTTPFDAVRLKREFGIDAVQSRTLPESEDAFRQGVAQILKNGLNP